ncbi:hypothetical protein U3516DRAFT_913691 [Neocallimastix sp. 'constans']
MNNYEVWLNQEVFHNEDDNDRAGIENLHQSNTKILGDIVLLDSTTLGTTSLFYATKKFNKDIFGESYTDKNGDNFEWCNDDDDDENDDLSSASENEMGWDYPLEESDNIWK